MIATVKKRTGFGGKLQALRIRLDLTQEEAGKTVGASKRAWQWWEANRVKPDDGHMMLIDLLEKGILPLKKAKKQ